MLYGVILMTSNDDGTTVAVSLNRTPSLHTMLWIKAVPGHVLQFFHAETEGE